MSPQAKDIRYISLFLFTI